MTEAVPWDDRAALFRWMEHHVGEVTPAMVERLLGHYSFVETGPMPTKGSARCTVWKFPNPGRDSHLAKFRVLVYEGGFVPREKVELILSMLFELERHQDALRPGQSASPTPRVQP